MPVSHSPNKSLGQHWLNDADSLNQIASNAEITSTDLVLEVGPGLGSLTEVLSSRAQEVWAIELDPDLINHLEIKFKNTNVQVLPGDILKYNLNDIKAPYKIVANLPYYLTSHFIQIISESDNPPTIATLLIQKEVAERIAAEPGKKSLLSVTAQYYWEANLSEVIKANLFTPPPKVDSQIIKLTRKQTLLLDPDETKLYFRIVKAGFSQKRKTLLNSLSAGLKLDRDQTAKLLADAQIDQNYRAQKLSLELWLKLYQAYKNLTS